MPLLCRRSGTQPLTGTSKLGHRGSPPAAGWASAGGRGGYGPEGWAPRHAWVCSRPICASTGSGFVFSQISATSFWKIPAWLSCAEDGKCQKLESARAPVVGLGGSLAGGGGRSRGGGGTRGSRSAPPQSWLGQTSAGPGLAVTPLWLRREAFPAGGDSRSPSLPSPGRPHPEQAARAFPERPQDKTRRDKPSSKRGGSRNIADRRRSCGPP